MTFQYSLMFFEASKNIPAYRVRKVIILKPGGDQKDLVMKRLLLLTVVLAIVFAATASAAVKQGDTELSIFGTFVDNEYNGGSSDETLVGALSIGHFFTDELELGLALMGMWGESTTAAGATTDSTLYAFLGNLKYHFMTESSTVPYVGYQYGFSEYETGTTSYDGEQYGPLVGIKFFMNENTTLFLEYQYLEYGGDVGDYIDETNLLMVGVSFLF